MAASRGVMGMSSLPKLRPVFSMSFKNLRKSITLFSSQDTSGQNATENTSTQEMSGGGTPLSPDRFPEGFNGAGLVAFGEEFSKKLMAPVNEKDVEIKPDGHVYSIWAWHFFTYSIGLIYLPEIKYRRILNHAFGPGGWALVPRGDSLQFQSDKDNSQLIVREYALFCFGRYVSQAAGEHTFYSSGNMVYGKAMEAAKSNALMRCCKDLGVASELWDPQFIIQWKETYAISAWCENVKTKEKKKMWRRKDRKPTDAFFYPWKEINGS